MRCDPLWEWEAKPRDFRCSICFKPGALLLGGSMVPNSLVPMGLRSTSPCSHGLSGRPQGGLCANAAQASVRPCEPQCWPEQPRAPRFPRGHADCHPTAPTLYLRDSVVNTACLQQAFPLTRWGCMSGGSLGLSHSVGIGPPACRRPQTPSSQETPLFSRVILGARLSVNSTAPGCKLE